MASSARNGAISAMTLIRVNNKHQALKCLMLLALGVAAASMFRRAVSLPDTTAVVIWPTVGLLVGFLLTTETRTWWLICLATFAIEFPFAIGSFSYEPPQGTLTKVAVYYSLLVTGCWLLRRRYAEGMALHRLSPDLRDFMLFVLAFCLLIGLIEPVFVRIAGGVSFGGLGWYYWAISNAASILVVAPVLIAWTSRAPNWRSMRNRGALLEFAFLVLLIGVIVVVSGYASAAVSQSLYDFIWIPLLLAVFRFDLRFVSLLLTWTAISVSVALAFGEGPFRFFSDSPSKQILVSSAYVLSCAAVLIILSAVLAGRANSRRKENRLREIIFESNRLHSIGAFAAGLTHDWNNLMLLLSFEKENLAERATLDSSLDSSVDALAQIIDEGRGISSGLLAFARRDREPISTCNLNQEVRVVANLAKRALPDNCQLMVDIADSKGLPVNARPSHLHQVVLNLLLNARDAMSTNGGTAVVKIRGPEVAQLNGSTGEVATIFVIDEGDGMPEEIVARAFEPLFSTKTERGGTGLGLSVTNSLVIAMGGEVAISSEEGNGTTVSVTLPLASEESGGKRES